MEKFCETFIWPGHFTPIVANLNIIAFLLFLFMSSDHGAINHCKSDILACTHHLLGCVTLIDHILALFSSDKALFYFPPLEKTCFKKQVLQHY